MWQMKEYAFYFTEKNNNIAYVIKYLFFYYMYICG